MKKYVLLLSVLFFSAVVESSFSLVTQNILGPNTQDVGEFSFVKGDYGRIDTLLQRVIGYGADVMCFQEWDSNAWKKLSQNTKQDFHSYELVNHVKKGTNGGVALYVKRSTGWSIKEKGSSFGQHACVWGLFEKNNQKVIIASLHLSRANDSRGTVDGETQLKDILRSLNTVLSKNNNVPVILAGDFNTFYSEIQSQTLDFLFQNFGEKFKMFAHKSWTVVKPNRNHASIDHVLYTHPLAISGSKSWVGNDQNQHKDDVVPDTYSDRLPSTPRALIDFRNNSSDHLPAFVTFYFSTSGKSGAGPKSTASTTTAGAATQSVTSTAGSSQPNIGPQSTSSTTAGGSLTDGESLFVKLDDWFNAVREYVEEDLKNDRPIVEIKKNVEDSIGSTASHLDKSKAWDKVKNFIDNHPYKADYQKRQADDFFNFYKKSIKGQVRNHSPIDVLNIYYDKNFLKNNYIDSNHFVHKIHELKQELTEEDKSLVKALELALKLK